jgi:hypothetical protein
VQQITAFKREQGLDPDANGAEAGGPGMRTAHSTSNLNTALASHLDVEQYDVYIVACQPGEYLGAVFRLSHNFEVGMPGQ